MNDFSSLLDKLTLADQAAAVAALGQASQRAKQQFDRFKQNVDAVSTCDRILVGLGTDTWDPACVLPKGHPGSCSQEPLTPRQIQVRETLASWEGDRNLRLFDGRTREQQIRETLCHEEGGHLFTDSYTCAGCGHTQTCEVYGHDWGQTGERRDTLNRLVFHQECLRCGNEVDDLPF